MSKCRNYNITKKKNGLTPCKKKKESENMHAVQNYWHSYKL